MRVKMLDKWQTVEDPDQTPQNAASELGLHCLLRPVFPNTLSKHGILIKSNPLRNCPGSAPEQQMPEQVDQGLLCSSVYSTVVIFFYKQATADQGLSQLAFFINL